MWYGESLGGKYVFTTVMCLFFTMCILTNLCVVGVDGLGYVHVCECYVALDLLLVVSLHIVHLLEDTLLCSFIVFH